MSRVGGRKRMTIQEAIASARASVVRNYNTRPGMPEREWLVAGCNSYENKNNRVELHVWNGSPAKGWVIANYGTGQVWAYSLDGRCLHRWDMPNLAGS